uniref:CUB domain-containing protein n=1 Tax=Knipowitschia caucasica TaxID=637954 RepID=A0AAV2IZ07_KNICA
MKHDYVQVEDETATASIVWGRWCGTHRPSTVTSKGNVVRVTFKSNDYFVQKPGFKITYSLLYDPPVPSNLNDPLLMSDFGGGQVQALVPEVPFSLEDLDRTIASFDTIKELLKSLNPDTWRQDLDSIYTADTHILYRSKAYHMASRHNKASPSLPHLRLSSAHPSLSGSHVHRG